MLRGLYKKARRYHQERARHAQDRRDVLAKRAEHFAAKRKGRPPSLLSRPQELRLKVYPATWDSLMAIGSLRMATPQMTATSILEGVCELWQKSPFDEELLLKRCEDPTEAGGSVIVGTTGEPSDNMSDPSVLWNMLAMSAYLLCLRGVPPQKVEAFFQQVLDIEDDMHKEEDHE